MALVGTQMWIDKQADLTILIYNNLMLHFLALRAQTQTLNLKGSLSTSF